MSRGRKSKLENSILNSRQIFNKNVGIYFQTIIVELGKIKESGKERAIDLLDEIIIEKTKISRNNKPFAVISEKEIPFEIPQHWVWCRLGEIIQLTDNLNIETALPPETLINYVDIEAIDNLNYKIRESKLKPVSELSSRARRILRKGYILYSLVRPYLNNIAIIEDDKENYIGSTGFTVFDGILVNNDYIKYVLLSDYVRKLFLEMLSGFNSPTITQEQFISTPIPLPPLSEQNQIVEFLSSFEDENINLDRCFFNQHIENKIKQLHESQLIGSALQTELKTQATLLTQLRQAYLQEAVMGQLTAQTTDDAHALLADIKAQKAQLIKEGKLRKEKPLPPIKPEEIPFEIPENWVWCRLGEVIILGSGQDLQPHEYSDIDNEGLPYITGASNLEDEKVIINRWTKTPKSIASRGDLLLTCKGSGVGKMAWLDEEKVHIARQIMSIRSSFVDTRYIKFILQLNAVKYRANAKSLIPGIDRNTVLLTLISLPPLSEQQAIVAKVAGLLEKVSALEAENKAQQAELERLMSAVLQESFSTTVSQTVQEV